MPTLPPYAEQDLYSKTHELKWSSTERAAARRAFQQQELDAAIRSTKEMVTRIKQPYELWELEHHLTELRKAVDSKYVYKYSKLVPFLTDLVAEGKLDLQDLRGLSEEKLHYIRRYAESSAA